MTTRATRRGARMAGVAALAWISASVATVAPAAALLMTVGSSAATLAAFAFAVRRRRGLPAVIVVAFACAAAVSGSVALAQPARSSVAGLDAGRVVSVEAVVAGRVAPGPSGEVWFDAQASTVSAGAVVGGGVPLRIGIRADEAASLDGVDLGARIAVRGSAIAPDPGERAALIVRAVADVELREPPGGLFAALAELRAGLIASAGELPGPGAALIPGLAVGDTAAVSAELDAAMTASSLSHLTAVSGANCAIVVGLALALAAASGATRGVRVAVAAAALALFVLLVTPEPSVVRAATMAGIALVAVVLGRPGAGLAVLGAAVTVLLIGDPWLAWSLGFALSAVATGALLVLAGPLAAGLGRFLPRPLALAVAVPLAAQLACAPLLVLVDPHVPLLGVVANMLAAPAAPVATVLGFFACLSAPLPVLHDGLIALAWVPASWIAGVATTVSAIPGQALPWPEGLGGAVLLAGVCAVLGLALVPRGARRWMQRMRGVAVVVVLVVGAGASGHVALHVATGGRGAPDAWQIALCDVGQGDAVLLRSAGAVALVDTGPEPERVADCLRRFGVASVDLLVLTHFDIDHIGGVEAVVGKVTTVVHGPVEPGIGDRVLAALTAAGASALEVGTGDAGRLGDAAWRTLWPSPSVDTAGNDASVVLEVTGGGLPTVLLLGDLSAEAQIRMRAAGRPGPVDVVKVAHHGSGDQDAALYDATSAAIALVPVGADNDYGHPRASLLALLTADGSVTARSDRDGAVAVWRDGAGLHLWREHGVGPAG